MRLARFEIEGLKAKSDLDLSRFRMTEQGYSIQLPCQIHSGLAVSGCVRLDVSAYYYRLANCRLGSSNFAEDPSGAGFRRGEMMLTFQSVFLV